MLLCCCVVVLLCCCVVVWVVWVVLVCMGLVCNLLYCIVLEKDWKKIGKRLNLVSSSLLCSALLGSSLLGSSLLFSALSRQIVHGRHQLVSSRLGVIIHSALSARVKKWRWGVSIPLPLAC